MRVLDLFSGIGGFSLGLEGAGMKPWHSARSRITRAGMRKDGPTRL